MIPLGNIGDSEENPGALAAIFIADITYRIISHIQFCVDREGAKSLKIRAHGADVKAKQPDSRHAAKPQ